jgi:uncharacterized protein (DUF433 family)
MSARRRVLALAVELTDLAIPQYLTRPSYSFAEADYLAGATKGTTRRWIKGYTYVRPDGTKVELPPVTPGAGQATAASFLELLEVVVIGRLKQIGFSLPEIRRIVLNIQDILDLGRPLVQARFKTDGREIFVDRGDPLLEVGRRKRMQAWTVVLGPFLEELHYSDGWADRWWPLGASVPVLIDPEFGFGRPVIEGSGVRTEIIIERVRAGDLPNEIANDFKLTELEVHRAIQYETSRQAA